MIDEIRKLRELTETLTGHGYLRDRAEEWEYVLDSLPDSIYIVNNDYQIKFINRALKRKLNLKAKQDIYDKVSYEVISGMPNPLDTFPNGTDSVVQADVYVEALKGWYSISRSPIVTDTNKLLGFIVILKDVTDKREIEFNLLARQQMLETIYRASPIGIGVVERDTRIIKFVNHALSEMLLYTEDKLVGKNARFLYPSELEYERVGVAKHGKFNTQRVSSIETKWLRVDGELLDIFLSFSGVPGGNDIVFTAMDITEVKRNETYLKRNEERLEALLELSKMSYLDEDAVTQYALEEGVRLTDSTIGYLHFVNGCGLDSCEGDVNLNLFTWTDAVKKECKAEKLAHYPLTGAGIWADSVRDRAPVIHNDYATEANKKGLPAGHIPLTRHMCVPVFEGDDIVAVAGVGNKELPYDQTDVYQLSIFMNSMWDILQRKQAERVAQESRDSLERIIATSPMGVLVYKLIEEELVLTHFNKTAQKILNMDGPSFVGLKLQEVFPKLAKGNIPEKYKKIAAEGGILKDPSYEYQDPEIDVSGVFSVFAFQSANNEVSVFFADVTEQISAREALYKSEEKFKMAFMTVPDAALILEAGTGKIVAVNPVACRSAGYKEEELVGKSVTEVDLWLTIDDRDTFYNILNKYGYVNDFPLKVRTKGGKEKDGILSSRIFELDNKPHVISIIKDVSAIMDMRQNICETEFLYKSIMDKVYEGVFLIQHEKFVLINKPLCNMLGYEESELVDKNFSIMIAPEDRERVLKNYRSRIAGEACLDKYESMLITKTGERIPIIIDANAIKYGNALASMGTVTRIE